MKELKVLRSKRPTNIGSIHKLEKSLAIKLPQDYVAFLLLHNGGRPVADTYTLIEPARNILFPSAENTEGVVNWFYCIKDKDLYDITENHSTSKGRIPSDLIAIGDDPYGNQICLCVKGKNCGKVYFWDHEGELEVEEREDPTYENVYLIANSFTDFINSLYEYHLPKEESRKGAFCLIEALRRVFSSLRNNWRR